jgi:hypothetical protein
MSGAPSASSSVKLPIAMYLSVMPKVGRGLSRRFVCEIRVSAGSGDVLFASSHSSHPVITAQ